MTKHLFITVWFFALSALILSSCDTPVGQGAAWGAATGAIIGGAATGNVRAASIGAAAGAAAGALTGAAIQQDQAARYVRRLRAVIRMRAGPERPVFIIVLTRGAFMIFAGYRPGD